MSEPLDSLAERLDDWVRAGAVSVTENAGRLVVRRLTGTPVSYTHLDVYKRQVEAYDRICRLDLVNRSCEKIPAVAIDPTRSP